MSKKYLKLKNLGNSCYFNTALQILLNSSDILREMFNKQRLAKLQLNPKTLYYSIIKLADAIVEHDNYRTIETKFLSDLYKTFCKLCCYNIGEQYDAFDALYSILNQLSHELCIENDKTQYHNYYENIKNIDINFITEIFKENDFAISQHYMTICINTIQGKCGKISTNTEILGFVNNYKDNLNLVECLHSFFGDIQLNDWYCENCKINHYATIKKKIIQLPKYLYIKCNKKKMELNWKITVNSSTYILRTIVIQEGNESAGHYYLVHLNSDEFIEINDEIIRKYNGEFIGAYFVIYKKID